jgi:hypothetical protein
VAPYTDTVIRYGRRVVSRVRIFGAQSREPFVETEIIMPRSQASA